MPTDLSETYRDRLSDACRHVVGAFVVVTKAWAERVLADCNNPDGRRNRRLGGHWKRLAVAMRRGGWEINGETIVFDRTGRLVQGQHRLTSVAGTGIPVGAIVLWGVRPECFATFDSGKVRNASDVLGICGHKNTFALAATLSWQIAYDAGEIDKARPPIPNDQAPILAARYPDLIESLSHFISTYGKQLYGRCPQSLGAFLYHQFSLRSQDAAKRFFDRVALGIEVPATSFERLLRDKLDRAKGVSGDTEEGQPSTWRRRKSRLSLSEIELAALFIKAFNGSRRGGSIPKANGFRWTCAETFPTISD